MRSLAPLFLKKLTFFNTVKYLNINILKKHLNIDKYFHDDDEYISQLGDVAEQMVDEHINNNLDNIVKNNRGHLPMPIKHAMMLLVGNLYQNREGIAFANASQIPHSYEYLLFPYKDYKNNKS